MKKITINNRTIQKNAKYGLNDPVCRIQEGKKITYALGVLIKGDSKLVYNPKKPLRCGARSWIETDADIELLGRIS